MKSFHKHSKDREDALETDTWLSVVTQNIGRISEAKELLFDYANSVNEDGLVSHGRWIIRHEEDGRADFELVTVPLHVGEILKKKPLGSLLRSYLYFGYSLRIRKF
ncbi:MAG: hypothetical protein CM1200mP24_03840 [Gammaproteobacteria bacterium]|nr:MAG: hypothetical protein CM1200mP24_03840 [Gammaproteobacteria bacterium]